MTQPTSNPATPPPMKTLQARVDEIGWYHSIDFGEGIRTPGVFDHRAILSKYPLPARLDGLRVLDVATFDGHWAFEMERRGAKEVIALDVSCRRDLDLPPRQRRAMSDAELNERFGTGFRLAHEVLGSKVQRVEMNVYDLSPERLGKFDIVHLGALLLHLHNPLKALANVYDVTRDRAIIAECYSRKLPLTLMRYLGGVDHCAWWSMSVGSLKQMIQDAGFSSVDVTSKFPVTHRKTGQKVWHAGFVAKV